MLQAHQKIITTWLFILIFSLGFNSTAIAKTTTGAVYTATNNSDENSIIAYQQFDDGTLEKIGEYKTGGKGTGLIELSGKPYNPDAGHPLTDGYDPLESAYALWRTPDNKNILVANAGDGTVSSLRVNKDLSLSLNNVVKAGNINPLSIATHGKLVYVASKGRKNKFPNDGTLNGYLIDDKGLLTPILDSERHLNGRPGSIEFTADAKFLVAVEVSTGAIHTYKVLENGSLSNKPISTIKSPLVEGRFLAIPIGTKIISKGGKNFLLVTEARFVDSKGKLKPSTEKNRAKYPFQSHYEGQTGSVTSFEIDPNGKLILISADVPAGEGFWGGQQTTCWITSSNDGKFAWTSNSFSASISSYQVGSQGELKLLEEISYQAPNNKEYYTDLDLSADGNYVNVLSSNSGTTWVFAINHDTGALKLINHYEGGAKIHTYGLVTIAK